MNKRIKQTKSTQELKKKLGMASFYIVLLSFLLLLFYPIPGLEKEIRQTFVIMIMGIFFWVTEIIEPPVTALLVIVLFPLTGVLTVQESFTVFSSPFIWLLVGVLIFSEAILVTKIDKRIVLHLMKVGMNNLQQTFLGILLSILVLTFFVPMAIGRMTMILPICQGLLQAIHVQKGDSFGKALMISVPFVSVLSSIAVMTGANAVVYAVALFITKLDYQWNYLSWMLFFFPITLLIILGIWLLFLIVFPFPKNTQAGAIFLKRELQELGPISFSELKVVSLFIIMIILWSTTVWHLIPIELITITMSIILFLPGSRILAWGHVSRNINWGMIFILAASLIFSKAIDISGASHWISSFMLAGLQGFTPYMLCIFILLTCMILRFAFTTTMGLAVTILPIMFVLADTLGMNPMWLGLVGLSGCTLSVLFPSQTPENVIAYATGYFTIKDMFKAGIVIGLFYITVITLTAVYYWPILGVGIYK